MQFQYKMVFGVYELCLLIFVVGAVRSECDPNVRQLIFESSYKPGENKRSITRIIPVRGCYMKELIQTCIKKDRELLKHDRDEDPGEWKVYAEAYVRCVLNTVYPEYKSKDDNRKRTIYSYGEKLAHLNSNDTVLRAEFYDVETKDLEDAHFDSNIVYLSKKEGGEEHDSRGMTYQSSTSLIDTAEWEKGYKYATRIEGEINIGLVKWSGGFDLTGDDQAIGEKNIKNVTTETAISIDFNVPTNKFVRTLWVAKRKKGYRQYFGKVMVSGWLWVHQTDELRNIAPDHPYAVTEYLFPVGDMAYYFDEFTHINSQKLFDNKRGKLATTDIVHSVIHLDEFPKDSACALKPTETPDMFVVQKE